MVTRTRVKVAEEARIRLIQPSVKINTKRECPTMLREIWRQFRLNPARRISKAITYKVRRWVGRGRRHRRTGAIVFVSLLVAARDESNSGDETAVRLPQESTPAESVSRPGRPAALQRAHERAELCGRQEPPLAAGRRWASRIALRVTSRGAIRSRSAAAARSTTHERVLRRLATG